MNVYGIEVAIKNTPVLDKGFIPMAAFTSAFEASAKNGKDIAVAVERNQGQVAVRRLKIHGTPAMDKADKVYVERTVKMLLWAYGGWKVVVCGDEALGRYIAEAYAPGGARAFDADFMGRVYERDFTVEIRPLSETPEAYSAPAPASSSTPLCLRRRSSRWCRAR